MSLAGNIPASIHELTKLSDEIWFLAGDTSADTSWYTRRATLSAVYASTGIYSYALCLDLLTNGVDRAIHDAGQITQIYRDMGIPGQKIG